MAMTMRPNLQVEHDDKHLCPTLKTLASLSTRSLLHILVLVLIVTRLHRLVINQASWSIILRVVILVILIVVLLIIIFVFLVILILVAV